MNKPLKTYEVYAILHQMRDEERRSMQFLVWFVLLPALSIVGVALGFIIYGVYHALGGPR